VVEDERRHEAVEDELRPLAVDLEAFQAQDRESNPLQAFIVVTDEEAFLHRPVGLEIITAGSEDQPRGLGPAALFERRADRRCRVAAVAATCTEAETFTTRYDGSAAEATRERVRSRNALHIIFAFEIAFRRERSSPACSM
jgi:hypothetical protein